MTRRELDVPELVRQRAARRGGEAITWLTGLPDLVGALEQGWAVEVGEPLAGGSDGYVARARTADGQDAVLKVAVPDPAFAGQVRTLQQADGRGYVRVLQADVQRGAVLLEALGTALERLPLPVEDRITALCTTLRAAWLPRPGGATPAQARAKAYELADLVERLWGELGRPCPERVVARALDFARRRAVGTSLDRAVVVHGDPHPGNALAVLTPRPGAESGFVMIDPDGFLADPAYDLGVVLREWSHELLAGDAPMLARRYCRLLAAHGDADEAAVWEWGFLERVSSGLFLLHLGATELAGPYLATAELLVDA